MNTILEKYLEQLETSQDDIVYMAGSIVNDASPYIGDLDVAFQTRIVNQIIISITNDNEDKNYRVMMIANIFEFLQKSGVSSIELQVQLGIIAKNVFKTMIDPDEYWSEKIMIGLAEWEKQHSFVLELAN